MPDANDRIAIESATSPGHVQRVDRAKYVAMRDALVAALPSHPPGIAVAEAKAALLAYLPETLFPGGAKAGWWLKAVQLDLEAKGLIRREPGKPVRLFRGGTEGVALRPIRPAPFTPDEAELVEPASRQVPLTPGTAPRTPPPACAGWWC